MHYDKLISDPLGAVRQIYQRLDRHLVEPASERIRRARYLSVKELYNDYSTQSHEFNAMTGDLEAEKAADRSKCVGVARGHSYLRPARSILCLIYS